MYARVLTHTAEEGLGGGGREGGERGKVGSEMGACDSKKKVVERSRQ